MRYHNLQELIANSTSSRKFFLSLPVSTQLLLHEYNDSIHSAAELHRMAEDVPRYARAMAISRMLL